MRSIAFFCLFALSCAAVDPPPATRDDATAPPANGEISITGVVTSEGVECPAVRGDDDQIYTIAGGDRSTLRPGTRVRVTGTRAQMSFCMQGTTIDATKIEVLSESR